MPEVESPLEGASPDEIVRRIVELATSTDNSTFIELRKLISNDYMSYGENFVAVSRLAARALLQKGQTGVRVLRDSVLEASFKVDVGSILDAQNSECIPFVPSL